MFKICQRNFFLRHCVVRRTFVSDVSGRSAWKAESLQEHYETAKLNNGITLEFRTGHVARFTAGSVILKHKENAILSTVVTKPRETDNILKDVPIFDLQLSVDFRQSAAAIGRIPTNYFRRDMQMSDQDIITSRIIDRSLRPSFYKKYGVPTQITCKPLALNETGDSAVLGVNVASAALAVSNVPMRCTVAAVRVAIVNGNFVINPSTEQLKHSTMNMVLSGTGTEELNRVFMIDMDGREISTDVFCEGLQLGMVEIGIVAAAIRRLAASVNKTKLNLEENELQQDVVNFCDEFSRDRITRIFNDYTHDKESRDNAINKVRLAFIKKYVETKQQLQSSLQRDITDVLNAYFVVFLKDILKMLTLKNKIRCDGRAYDEFRPINAEVGVYDKLHGSAIFQRGQSQVFATVTFDSPQAAFHPDSIAQMLGAQRQKSFMLHYEFPKFATNELGSSFGGSNRREIGHGMLAEKALKHVILPDFPYTIRLAAQVLESNGSTSMASACAGSLALFDAGVSLHGAVGGVAVGLFSCNENNSIGTEDAEDAAFLMDITGMEDFFGDMDFKMAGTSKGFTAMQMDLKICGLSQRHLQKALSVGRRGIDHVLSKMANVLARSRDTFKASVPIMETWNLPSHLRRFILFRNGAYNAKLVESETGVQVTAEEENVILLMAPNREKLNKAKELIEKLLCEKNEIEMDFGAYYKAEISEILEHGAMVTLKKGTRPLFIHNSQLSNKRIGHASSLGLSVGDEITVRYYGRDQQGFHRLSGKMISNSNIAIQNRFSRRRNEDEITKLKDC